MQHEEETINGQTKLPQWGEHRVSQLSDSHEEGVTAFWRGRQVFQGHMCCSTRKGFKRSQLYKKIYWLVLRYVSVCVCTMWCVCVRMRAWVCPIYMYDYAHGTFEICNVLIGMKHLGTGCLSNKNDRCCFLYFSKRPWPPRTTSRFMKLKYDFNAYSVGFLGWRGEQAKLESTEPGILSKRGDRSLLLPEEFMASKLFSNEHWVRAGHLLLISLTDIHLNLKRFPGLDRKGRAWIPFAS